MRTYTFKTLNDKEFEILVGDLLSKELGCNFQSFKSGKDKGIDLRYSKTVDNQIIVQVKHYAKSSYSQLKYQFKNKELPKIKKLAPERYIIATSLELTPTQAEELKEILTPYVKSIDDIYWNQRINALISKYNGIEKNHFKLWFSSSSVLSNLLNNSSYLKAKHLEIEVEKKISLYVKTAFHDRASDTLKKQKVLLITGAPGVGKSTLAEMITFDYINHGYEHLVIEDKISEAEQLISPDSKKKQIIYFDDFLGSNIYEILNPRNSETALSRFINRIQNSPSKYLILTTRTTILNQALSSFEKIRYQKLHTNCSYQIDINEYSLIQKAEILYNHIYFGNLEDAYSEKIFEDKSYIDIINHQNYNPRLIEFFTSPYQINLIPPDEYLSFIKDNLENPSEIWRNSFESQINDEERFLIITLLSLRGESSLVALEDAFNSRIANEISKYGYRVKNNSFNNSIKKLEVSYIKTFKSKEGGDIQISFVNPSISDFLINYLKDSKFEQKRLLEGIKFLDQITNLFHPHRDGYIKFDENESAEYYSFLLKKQVEFNMLDKDKNANCVLLNILFQFFPKTYDEKNIVKIFMEIEFGDIDSIEFSSFMFVIERASEIEELKSYIIANWDSLIYHLYWIASDGDDYDQIVYLFDDLEQSYSDFIDEEENNYVTEILASYLSGAIEENIKDNIYSYSFREEMESYIDEDGYEQSWIVSYSLEDDIDDIILQDLEEYQKMRFLEDGPYIDSSDLDIETSFLKETIEESHMEHQAAVQKEYRKMYGTGYSSYSRSSDSDMIDNLFD